MMNSTTVLLGLVASFCLVFVQPASAQEWVTVEEWSGKGIKHTETFTIPGDEWRITWSARNEVIPGGGILQIMVYTADGELKTLAANQQGTGSDTSYLRGGGRYYLTINSANVNWMVRVQRRR